MKEFIGHKIRIVVESVGSVVGILTGENKTLLFVKGEDEKIVRIPKSKICLFTGADSEPSPYIPFTVLYCENKSKKCDGVQMVIEGNSFSQSDILGMMKPCKCGDDTCKYGSKGELRALDGKLLVRMFKDAMFGEYPEKQGES